jgi:predicted lipoprotein with Yx(FWY)xxD motif
MDRLRGPGRAWRLGLRLAGAGLLIATGAVHLDLYLTGYRTIPTIGWLFLLQVLTLYWFVPDNTTTSACYGSCAQYWPPVFGTPKAGPGVTGSLGTIRRSDGTTQATYDGHPLYTYIGDSAPGQNHGNNVTLNGGLWHEVLVAG